MGATQATLVAGSNISTTLAGVTSGHFGRTAKDANILYLATSGGGYPLSFPDFFLFASLEVLIVNRIGITHQRNRSRSRKYRQDRHHWVLAVNARE